MGAPEDIVVIGGGGHARVVLDALAQLPAWHVVGVVRLPDEPGDEVLGVPVIGTRADLDSLRAQGVSAAVVGVGSVGDPRARIEEANAAQAAGLRLPAIVHPSAVVSPSARLAEGVFVAAGAVVCAASNVGFCAIVNTGAVVDHDCVLGAFVHVSPGAVLSGGVTVGDRSHVGTGTAVSHGVNVGADTTIGVGAVVVRDIEAGVVAYGNPARPVRSRS